MTQNLLIVLIIILAGVGGTYLTVWFGKVAAALEIEAKEKGKRIEFAAVGVSILAFLVSVGGLIYSANVIDKLSEKVDRLESQLKEQSAQTQPSPGNNEAPK